MYGAAVVPLDGKKVIWKRCPRRVLQEVSEKELFLIRHFKTSQGRCQDTIK